MATLRYSDIRGTFRVEIVWCAGWTDTEISCDRLRIATIATKAELQAGQTLTAPDGSILKVKLSSGRLPLPEVELNGKPLRMSVTDHHRLVRTSFHIVVLVGVLNFTVGLLGAFTDLSIAARFGAGYPNIAYGIVFLVLSYFVRRSSAIALSLAILLFCYDSVIWLLAITSHNVDLPAVAVIVRLIFVASLVRGLWAIWIIKTRYLSSGAPT